MRNRPRRPSDSSDARRRYRESRIEKEHESRRKSYLIHRVEILAHEAERRRLHPELKAKRNARNLVNREQINAKRREWIAAHRDHLRAARAARYAKDPEGEKTRAVAYIRQRKYGITAEGLAALIASQGGLCAICGVVFEKGRSPHVDHDHASGATRGALCRSCNLALGMLRDDPSVLRRAAEYLEKHRSVLLEARS